MGNQTWLAEVLFAGLDEGERERVLDVMGEVTDAQLRLLRSKGAAPPQVSRVNRARLKAKAGVERLGQQ